ncbi:aldehyde dehydrogenase family protein [Peribacillus frigoritolerans]|nr:aldehyde dehydrogenase family protein [Peribacillus frigoritolerans]
MQKAADSLKRNMQEVGQDLIQEEGKTFLEGMGEANRAASILEYYAAEARQPLGEVIPSANANTFLYTTRTPARSGGFRLHHGTFLSPSLYGNWRRP